MMASGAWSFARTRLPAETISAPVRPAIGARIVAYWSCTLAFSTAARSAATVAARAVALARVWSTCSRGTRPLSARSWVRCAETLAWSACAESRARFASAWWSSASRGRRSNVKRTCPACTSSPCWKLTEVSSPVICARTTTVLYASVVPIRLISRGMSFWTTGATFTGTPGVCGADASRCVCCAELPKHAGECEGRQRGDEQTSGNPHH